MDTVNHSNFEKIIELAQTESLKIVLVHNALNRFPDVSRLAPHIQPIFKSIAVPYVDTYAKHCWKKVEEKLLLTKMVLLSQSLCSKNSLKMALLGF